MGDTFIQFVEFTKKAWHTVWKHIKSIKIRFALSKRILCTPHTGKTWSCYEISKWISFGLIENVWGLQNRLAGGKRCQYTVLPFQPLLLHGQIQINGWWLTIPTPFEDLCLIKPRLPPPLQLISFSCLIHRFLIWYSNISGHLITLIIFRGVF